MDIRICERDTKPVIKKKNVYITGHAKDVFRFETIAEEILSLLDCKVYINNTVQFDEKIEEHLFFLAEMDVIVVAVTKSFLTEDNPARDIEFEFIKEKKIPVLPILLEENFEHVFDSVCGNWQLLNRRSVDYKKKLEEYLNFIFGDDELHASVQNVLTGEVFLSYRKKERKHVLQLMHMIHEFDTCEDLKIWYDDFLTLGEKYDEEIDYHGVNI